METEKDKLYPTLPGMGENEQPCRTDRIIVSDLPQSVTEDALKLFFGKKKIFNNVTGVQNVDLDDASNTAVIIFKDEEDVERIINKIPILYNDKAITVERYYLEEEEGEEEEEKFDKCTIEVKGVNPKTDKFTLKLYFESETASGKEVDVLDIEYDTEDGIFLVRFENEEVVNAIVKRNHTLNNSELNVRKHIPLPPDATYPRQVFVEGFNKNTPEDALVNFLEGRSKEDVEKVIYGEIEGTAIVVFQKQPDIDKLQKEFKNKRLSGKNLTVDVVPVSKCIIVSNIKPGTKEEAVMFYFDNHRKSGVEGVERVEMDDRNHTCIVYFVDTEAPITACKKTHIIEGTKVKTEIYQECLGGTATGDGPRFKPLDPLQINLDKRKAHFLSFAKPFHEELNKNLIPCHAEVQKWPESKILTITIKCLLTSETKDCKKLAKTWEREVKTCLDKALTSITEKQFKMLQDAWKPVKEELSSITVAEPERVGISLEASECTIYIIGYQKQVNGLHDQIKKIVDQIMAEIEQKKQQVIEKIELKSYQIDILMQKDFKSKDLKSFRNLQVLIEAEKRMITFDGLSKEVTEAKIKMYEGILNKICNVKVGTLSRYKLEYSCRPEVALLIKEVIRKKKKVCFWEIKDDNIVMYAMSDKEAAECFKIFNKFVNETVVKLEKFSDSVLRSAMWKEQVTRMKEKYKVFYVDIISESDQVIILSTDGSKFGILREEVQDFLAKNMVQRREYNVTTGQMKLIESQLKRKLKDIEKGLEKEKVRVTITSDSIVVEGNEVGINCATFKVDEILKEVETKEHTIKKPGIGKYMMTEGRKKIESTEKAIGVVIEADINTSLLELNQNSKVKHNQSPREESGNIKPTSRNDIVEVAKASLSEGCVVIAVLGDITLLNADVITNAANNDLDHRGGLACVIISKGGKAIQDECTKHIKQNNSLSEGEVFFSKAGKLKCREICHAVGPTWKGGGQDEEDCLKMCVLLSLAGTDEKSYSSIALPAISTGIFGYPVDKATNTIVGAVQEYFQNNPKSKIKKIFLCDIVDNAVDCFVKGMKKNFSVQNLAKLDKKQRWRQNVPDDRDEVRTREKKDQKNRCLKFGNITVNVVRGQLTQQKVDVIVNSTSRDLNLENGLLSKSILNAGGQTIQNECKQNYPKGIQEGDVAVTSGGKLACRHVFHGCFPSWKHDQSSIKVLESFVMECLDTTEKKQLTSIAFPSLGTGNLGYPVDKVAKQMFSCVENFSKSNSDIKEVLLVVYEKDHKSIQGFEDEYRKRLGASERVEGRFNEREHYNRPQTGRGRPGRPGTARPKTSHARKYTVQFGKIEVKIYQGDITTANVDVVVYSSNTQCDLRQGAVAQAIMKKGGESIITEVNKQKDKMKKDGFIVTTAGKLPCSKLIHLDMQETQIDLKTKIFQVLKKTDELHMQTMALPALGTANANMDVDSVAREMLGVIANFHPQHVQEVHIIIYQGTMVKSFIDATDKHRPDITREPSQFIDIPSKQMKFGPNSETRMNREWKKVEISQPPSEFKVTIIAKNKADVDHAIKTLNKHIDDAFVTEEIKAGKVVGELKKEQLEELKQIAYIEGVEIKPDSKSGKLVLKGFLVNLALAQGKANSVIDEAEQGRLAGLKANVMKESVQWYFMKKKDGKDQLVEYPVDINMQLESEYQGMKNQTKITDKKGKSYIIDFGDMEEYAERDRNDYVAVLRKSKIMDKDNPFTLPETWDAMDDTEYYRPVVLKSGTKEYQDVEKKFLSSVGSRRSVIEIYRIQNKTLYQQFMAKKVSIDSINPKGHQNERKLWHGFAKDAMDSINKFGFNRSYCGKNATAYGDGVYFARDASYSANDRYSVPDNVHHKRMYWAQVLTGEYTTGGYGMRIPPPKPVQGVTQSHILYDSVVDDANTPSMFIIFHDVQAYPQYMIVFT